VDFRRLYGFNLAEDVGTYRLTWGRFRDFVARLPQDSCHARGVAGDVGEWTTDRQLLAAVIDHLRVNNWQLGQLGLGLGFKKNPMPEPTPVPRPGVEAPRKSTGMASLAAAMGQRPKIR
jgi:hypothetical protein